MSLHPSLETSDSAVPEGLRRFLRNRLLELSGLSLIGAAGIAAVCLASWRADDPSFNHATDAVPQNLLGWPGAAFADELMQGLGLGTIPLTVIPLAWAFTLLGHAPLDRPLRRLLSWPLASAAAASLLASFPIPDDWVLGTGLGGGIGDVIYSLTVSLMGLAMHDGVARGAACVVSAGTFLVMSCNALGIRSDDIIAWTGVFGTRVEAMVAALFGLVARTVQRFGSFLRRLFHRKRRRKPAKVATAAAAAAKAASARAAEAAAQREAKVVRVEPRLIDQRRRSKVAIDEDDDEEADEDSEDDEAGDEDEEEEGEAEEDASEEEEEEPPAPRKRVTKAAGPVKPGARSRPGPRGKFEIPPLSLLAEPKLQGRAVDLSDEVLQHNARMLEGVLEDFGVRGEIINVRPGPVVTLYELEPAPGIKSSRVIGLADDIARSMSAVSVRVAVVPGRNVIGIELPNAKRETVFLRELLGSEAYEKTGQTLCLALGKNIGGEPIFADLARMPHLLIAGTTGSGKSVGINTMILSLLYRLTPERCRLIMIDPKMLELSVYEGIPHLLAPVVTDPRKAVVALKWAVREMEDRYRKMSKLGVRNIDGFNQRVAQALAKGETVSRTVQTGYDELDRRADLREGADGPQAHPLHRRHHRRDGRPDDGRRQGHRGRRPAPRPDGARRRHPCHHGDPAPFGRRHHRHHQGQLPHPHQLPGHLQDRQPHHSRRAGRRAAARPGRHALHGRRRPHLAPPFALRHRGRGREDRPPSQGPGLRPNMSTASPRRPRTRMAVRVAPRAAFEGRLGR